MTTYTNPPKSCDICSAPITDEFSDAALPAYGYRWGNICPDCSSFQAVEYGTGKGQRYQLRPDGKYHKVEG